MNINFNYFKSTVHSDHHREYIFPSLRIAHIIEGEFDWEIGSNTYTLSAGDIVLLNNLLPRTIKNQSKPLTHIDIFEFLPIELMERPLLAQAFYGQKTNIIFHQNGNLVRDLLLTISTTYETVKNQAFREHIMQAVFDMIEDMFCHSNPPNKHSDLSVQAANFIWDHFADGITVSSVAEYLYIGKNQLEKAFKQTYGVCVGTYIRSIRVYHVMCLLQKNDNRSVLDIALSCGFKSSSGFYKTYKSLVGSTPKTARF